jgi:hypothetical protein
LILIALLFVDLSLSLSFLLCFLPPTPYPFRTRACDVTGRGNTTCVLIRKCRRTWYSG